MCVLFGRKSPNTRFCFCVESKKKEWKRPNRNENILICWMLFYWKSLKQTPFDLDLDFPLSKLHRHPSQRERGQTKFHSWTIIGSRRCRSKVTANIEFSNGITLVLTPLTTLHKDLVLVMYVAVIQLTCARVKATVRSSEPEQKQSALGSEPQHG